MIPGFNLDLAEIVAPGRSKSDAAFRGQTLQTTEQSASQVSLGSEQRELFSRVLAPEAAAVAPAAEEVAAVRVAEVEIRQSRAFSN